MAKRFVNNEQELINFAQDYRIETEGKSIQDVAQELCDKLMSYYDQYYMYIDNYKQMQEAERRNKEIEEEVASIKKFIETLNVQEDTTMKNANETTATNNNTTIIKEENAMMKRMEELMEQLKNNQKVQDAGYIKKDKLRAILNDEFQMGFNKKATRDEMVQALVAMYKDSIRIADEVAYGNEEASAPKNEAPAQAVAKNDAKAKTDKLFALIKANAADNQKKGYGYTISSFMLQACILNAGAGVEKFKGHTITEEEAQMTKTVYQWLLKNKYVQPIVYSVAEDDKVRVYMDGYTGRTDSAKTKMIPYSKSAGYTAKKVTSFLVTIS